MSIEDKDKLEKLLSYHDNLYYNNDDPEISDLEYDSIKNKYVSLYGEYNYVPGKASSLFEKVTHKRPVLSLQKVQSVDKDTLRTMIEKLLPVIIQPKFDGLTLVVDNVIATRGNGEIGEDVTENAFKINGIHKLMGFPFAFRGEALILKDKFIELNEIRVKKGLEPFRNARNAAAGMLRNKDSDKVEGLTFFAYDMFDDNKTTSDQLNYINPLTKGDIYVTPYEKFDNVDEALKFIEKFDREKLNYEVDGLVVKSDVENSLEKFGTTSGYPLNAFAIKFPSQGKWTRLKSVTYQLGRTGKVTPVAEIEPIDILGSTISRVTLHNERIMNILGIKHNSEVFVVKANDVIPAIIEARGGDRAFEERTKCPICQSLLEKVNDQTFCRNRYCSDKLTAGIKHLGKRDSLDIKGLSESTAMKLALLDSVDRPEDIFSLTEEQIITMEGFAEKSTKNLYNSIQNARRNVALNRFMYAAGLPNVGRTASKDIANKLGTLELIIKDIETGFPKIQQIDGIGEVIMNSLKNNCDLFIRLNKKIKPLPTVIKTDKAGTLTIVITGSFTNEDVRVSREEIKEKVERLGHKVSNSVSRNTDVVLAGSKAGSKLIKARELGTTVFEDLKSFYEHIEL